jgi:DNA-binding protein BldD-like, C-terminal domain/Helix-turn-helix domain
MVFREVVHGSSHGRGREVVRIDISGAAGRELRRVRRERGLTLQDVRRRSRNNFKPSALGSHERGQRGLSLARFCELAWLYGIPPDQLLAEVLRSLAASGGIDVVIDLDRLSMSRGPEITLLAEHVDRVRSLRHDFLSNVITLRSGDIEALAGRAQIRPVELLGRLAGLLHRAPRPGA